MSQTTAEPNKRDCVPAAQSPQTSTPSSAAMPSMTETSNADSAVGGPVHGRMPNTLSSFATATVTTANSQSASLLATIKTTPTKIASRRGAPTSTAPKPSSSAPTQKAKSVAHSDSTTSNQANRSSGKRHCDKGSPEARASRGPADSSSSSNADEGGATIIRQATASSPTRTVKIPGLGSKLFKKCKSATFQIDGATYTIGKYPSHTNVKSLRASIAAVVVSYSPMLICLLKRFKLPPYSADKWLSRWNAVKVEWMRESEWSKVPTLLTVNLWRNPSQGRDISGLIAIANRKVRKKMFTLLLSTRQNCVLHFYTLGICHKFMLPALC